MHSDMEIGIEKFNKIEEGAIRYNRRFINYILPLIIGDNNNIPKHYEKAKIILEDVDRRISEGIENGQIDEDSSTAFAYLLEDFINPALEILENACKNIKSDKPGQYTYDVIASMRNVYGMLESAREEFGFKPGIKIET